MDTYKVEITHGKTKRSVSEAVHVMATNRENALYKAYDEMTDRGFKVVGLGDVSLYDEKTEMWHVIPSHRDLSKTVG